MSNKVLSIFVYIVLISIYPAIKDRGFIVIQLVGNSFKIDFNTTYKCNDVMIDKDCRLKNSSSPEWDNYKSAV